MRLTSQGWLNLLMLFLLTACSGDDSKNSTARDTAVPTEPAVFDHKHVDHPLFSAEIPVQLRAETVDGHGFSYVALWLNSQQVGAFLITDPPPSGSLAYRVDKDTQVQIGGRAGAVLEAQVLNPLLLGNYLGGDAASAVAPLPVHIAPAGAQELRAIVRGINGRQFEFFYVPSAALPPSTFQFIVQSITFN